MIYRRGFTLIELLVVIAIIALLSSVVLASLNATRAKARDAKRLSDIHQIQIALEQYYSENGKYPDSTACGATIPNTSWCNSIESLSGGHWIGNGALAQYLSVDPIDPAPAAVANFNANNNGGTYFYYSGNAGAGCAARQYYIFTAGMEIVSNQKKTFYNCDGTPYTSGGSYVVGVSVK